MPLTVTELVLCAQVTYTVSLSLIPSLGGLLLHLLYEGMNLREVKSQPRDTQLESGRAGLLTSGLQHSPQQFFTSPCPLSTGPVTHPGLGWQREGNNYSVQTP